MTSTLLTKLAALSHDNESGSVTVTNHCVEALQTFIEQANETGEELKNMIDMSVIFIEQHFDQFMAIRHFTRYFNEARTRSDEKKDWLKALQEYLDKWHKENDAIADNAIRLLNLENKSILLHSQSQTITTFIARLAEQNIQANFFQTESRPAEEGRAQAMRVADLGFQVTFIADAAVCRFMDEIDCAIVGADLVLEKYFVNKIGTYAIGLACSDHHKPLYVLTDSRKLGQNDLSKKDELEKQPVELWQHPGTRIRARNYYFEKIPNRLITKLITEKNPF